MASWGNQQGAQFQQDMDSNGQKLVVRNSDATVGTDYQAEIADTSNTAQALRINGKIEFQRNGRTCGHIESDVTDSDPNFNVLAINTGSDDPHVTIGHGTSMTTGNIVTINGKNVAIGGGSVPANFRTSIVGPVNVSTEGTNVALQAYGPVKVLNANGSAGGTVSAGHVDAINSTSDLAIGDLNAAHVLIGHAGATSYTDIKNRLFVKGNVEISIESGSPASLSVQSDISAGGTISTSGSILGVDVHAEGTLSGTVLGVTGNASFGGGISGNAITVSNQVHGGSLATTGAITGGSLDVSGTADCGSMNARDVSTIRADADLRSTLEIDQTSLTAQHPAVTILNASTESPSADTATLYLEGRQALYASGLSTFADAVDFAGAASHQANVAMNGHTIVLGGSGSTLVELRFGSLGVFEVWVGGQRRFHVDQTGGHNG